MRKVLYVCHNHPSERPGGVETYSVELYEAMRGARDFEPLLLAHRRRRGQSPTIAAVDEDPHQFFINTSDAAYDVFMGAAGDKRVVTRHYRDFLVAQQPDIVHFQHTLFLGYDLIRQTRTTLPHVPIVYTLHEFLPICHNNGQMVRTDDLALCEESSPSRCHACFPDIGPALFALRQRFVQSHFSEVSMFFAPSHFLRDRYVQWGIPENRIRYEEYGRSLSAVDDESDSRRVRNRFGFFGQLSAFKGVNVLLEAMRLLKGDGRSDIHLSVHGANLESQPRAFQYEFRTLVDATRETVTFAGRYDQTNVSQLIRAVDWVVVPSIWWENSPLVIQEAFAHGRPVICSGIGGMREKVSHGVNGLHCEPADAHGLADAIRQAASSTGLWEALRSGIPPIYRMDAHVQALVGTYRSLLHDSSSAH